VRQEEVLLIAVIELRQAGGDPDQYLFDTAEPSGAEPGVYSDTQRRHPEADAYAAGVNASRPKVSAVIPNHNGATPRNGLTYLELILPSLREQSFRDFDVTVVDNGSTDGSAEYLAREWPEVRVVELAGNMGFPAAVNRGIAASRGEYIALLNNDLELSANWMEQLVGELERDAALGFVTGKILRFAERDVIEQAGHDFYTCGLFAQRGRDEKDTGQYEDPAPTAIVGAAAAIYRRAAVDRAGAFDEDYFLYCEDADLCLRMLLAGYHGLYVPGPEAYHVRGGTAGQNSERSRFYLARNTLITQLKDLPAVTLLEALPKILLYQYQQFAEARASGLARTMLRAYGSFLRALFQTLRKRRRIQRSRRITAEEFASNLLSEYPLRTRFIRRRPPVAKSVP
jgi:GT2 family glycosyltransferase